MPHSEIICRMIGHTHILRKVFYDEEERKVFAIWSCPVCRDSGISEEADVQKVKERRSLGLALAILLATFGAIGAFSS